MDFLIETFNSLDALYIFIGCAAVPLVTFIITLLVGLLCGDLAKSKKVAKIAVLNQDSADECADALPFTQKNAYSSARENGKKVASLLNAEVGVELPYRQSAISKLWLTPIVAGLCVFPIGFAAEPVFGVVAMIISGLLSIVGIIVASCVKKSAGKAMRDFVTVLDGGKVVTKADIKSYEAKLKEKRAGAVRTAAVAKEKPVKEKPVKEKPVKEKPVKEKKEKPIKSKAKDTDVEDVVVESVELGAEDIAPMADEFNVNDAPLVEDGAPIIDEAAQESIIDDGSPRMVIDENAVPPDDFDIVEPETTLIPDIKLNDEVEFVQPQAEEQSYGGADSFDTISEDVPESEFAPEQEVGGFDSFTSEEVDSGVSTPAFESIEEVVPVAPEVSIPFAEEPEPAPEVTVPPIAEPEPEPEVTIPPVAEPAPEPEVTIPPITEPAPAPEVTITPIAEPAPAPEVTIPPVAQPAPAPEVTIPPATEPAPKAATVSTNSGGYAASIEKLTALMGGGATKAQLKEALAELQKERAKPEAQTPEARKAISDATIKAYKAIAAARA